MSDGESISPEQSTIISVDVFLFAGIAKVQGMDDVDTSSPSSNNYCHPTVYIFGTWSSVGLIFVFIVLRVLVCIFSCCKAGIKYCCKQNTVDIIEA